MALYIVKEQNTGLYLAGTGKFPPLRVNPHVYTSESAARGAITHRLPARPHYRRTIPYYDADGAFKDVEPDFVIQEVTFNVESEKPYEPVSKA